MTPSFIKCPKKREYFCCQKTQNHCSICMKSFTLLQKEPSPHSLGKCSLTPDTTPLIHSKKNPSKHHPHGKKQLSYTFPAITIKERVVLDFGAGGKGYLVDIIGVLIESFGINTYTIDAGGDILHKGKDGEALKVGLENPNNFKQIIGVADITSGSICGSAGNRRVWGNFHHIIDPKTLTSPRSIASVWTTAKTALLADSLATCLFFSPHNELKKHFDFEYAILYSDFSLEKSEKFPGEFFTQ